MVWVLIPHFAVLPLWCSAGIVALMCWRAWLTWNGKRLPHRIVLIILMCVAGFGIYAEFRTIFGKDAGVAYIILLLGLKLLEMRARRDIFIVIFLCLFVMLTGFFETQTMFDALAMMIGLLLLITALVSANFIDYEPSYAVKLKLAGQLTLYALPLMAVLFVLFPRIQGPLWGMPNDAYSSRTGLSDSMSPGSFGSLAQSNEIALRARFSGRIPTPSERYWRGPVLGNYDGQTWRPMQRWQMRAVPFEIDTDNTSAVEYTVTQEISNRPWLMTLEATPAPPQNLGMAGSAYVRRDMQVVTLNPIRERLRYSVHSYTRYQTGRNEDMFSLQQWLELPPGFNPRTLAMAAQWQNEALQTNGTSNHAVVTRSLVNRALQMIRNGNFVYTLNPPPLGRNSVDEFLFGTRRGFCEHYAGAFVVLMRALDIPARVVTGYQGGDINPVDGYMEVRQRDAHAWAEVWLADQGWIRVDPTAAVAPERVERGFQQLFGQTDGFASAFFNANDNWIGRLQQQLRFNMDAITNGWNQWILGYGTERQSSLFSGLGIQNIDWQGLTLALIVVFGLMLGVIGIQLIGKRERIDPVAKLYFSLCDRVARMTGPAPMKRQPNEGPSTYLARIKPLLPQHQRTLVEEAFRIYEKLRYARPAKSSADSSSSSDLIQQFKTCITQLRS